MYRIYHIVFFALFCASAARIAAAGHTRLGRQVPLLHESNKIQQSTPLPNIDDTDYWDNDDDFVPYKGDRHDDFDWKILKHVLRQDNKNVIISPFSVKLVLALLAEAAGANTETQKELGSVLPNLKSPVLVRDLYKKILGSLQEKSRDYVLNVGTKIFVDEFIEPRQRYASIIHSHYGTDIQKLNFHESEKSAAIINDWSANITAGRINDLISKDALHSSVMVILNAIFFDGIWKTPFLQNHTVELPFFVNPSAEVRAQFMTSTSNFYFFESNMLDAKMLRLPYRGKKFSMTIILPNRKQNLDELAKLLNGDSLKRLQWLMEEREVRVSLPKFKFDYTLQLNEFLRSLGIKEIFSSSASLPGLARGSGLNNQLRVSTIIQKAGLEVNEKGTQAAVATSVVIENKTGADNSRDFNANQPFLFFIEDETTGTVIFAGKVTDPTK